MDLTVTRTGRGSCKALSDNLWLFCLFMGFVNSITKCNGAFSLSGLFLVRDVVQDGHSKYSPAVGKDDSLKADCHGKQFSELYFMLLYKINKMEVFQFRFTSLSKIATFTLTLVLIYIFVLDVLSKVRQNQLVAF